MSILEKGSDSLKIALLGYGKMGQLVEKIATQSGISVTARVNSQQVETQFSAIEKADVCIDFSHPESVIENIERAAKMRKNLVVGTTGWYQDLEKVKKIVHLHQVGLIYSPNFSIGISLFLRIIAEAAAMINDFPEYDVGGYEFHHEGKVDSPSGTAKAIANVLLDKVKRKDSLVFDIGNRQRLPSEIQFSSLRCGAFPGTHTVIFDSSSDTVTLTHQARNRESFAVGALKAAEWIQGKKGVFTLEDMLG